ncbi:hypothetical protein KIPB_012421, partial [Kipferlia bialata]
SVSLTLSTWGNDAPSTTIQGGAGTDNGGDLILLSGSGTVTNGHLFLDTAVSPYVVSDTDADIVIGMNADSVAIGNTSVGSTALTIDADVTVSDGSTLTYLASSIELTSEDDFTFTRPTFPFSDMSTPSGTYASDVTAPSTTITGSHYESWHKSGTHDGVSYGGALVLNAGDGDAGGDVYISGGVSIRDDSMGTPSADMISGSVVLGNTLGDDGTMSGTGAVENTLYVKMQADTLVNNAYTLYATTVSGIDNTMTAGAEDLTIDGGVYTDPSNSAVTAGAVNIGTTSGAVTLSHSTGTTSVEGDLE